MCERGLARAAEDGVRLSRLIPQFVVIAVCAMRKHRQRRYEATVAGRLLVVYTCRCGRSQSAGMHAANRKIRRGLKRARL